MKATPWAFRGNALVKIHSVTEKSWKEDFYTLPLFAPNGAPKDQNHFFTHEISFSPIGDAFYQILLKSVKVEFFYPFERPLVGTFFTQFFFHLQTL